MTTITLAKINPAGVAAPTTTDDETEGYAALSTWLHDGRVYVCHDATEAAAVWVALEPAPAVIEISDENVDLAAEHDRATLVLTHATPKLTIEPQASETYPDGFRCEVVFVNAGELIGDTGVDINGETAETFDVPARPNVIGLTRLGEDDWLALGGIEVAE